MGIKGLPEESNGDIVAISHLNGSKVLSHNGKQVPWV